MSPLDLVTVLAANPMDKQLERFGPLVLLLVGLFILFLRWRDTPDQDEDEELPPGQGAP